VSLGSFQDPVVETAYRVEILNVALGPAATESRSCQEPRSMSVRVERPNHERNLIGEAIEVRERHQWRNQVDAFHDD
jgi:hypothetical protein